MCDSVMNVYPTTLCAYPPSFFQPNSIHHQNVPHKFDFPPTTFSTNSLIYSLISPGFSHKAQWLVLTSLLVNFPSPNKSSIPSLILGGNASSFEPAINRWGISTLYPSSSNFLANSFSSAKFSSPVRYQLSGPRMPLMLYSCA
ncbi:hypothetical protein ACMFMF_011922 [Clarireedia jacksonii]